MRNRLAWLVFGTGVILHAYLRLKTVRAAACLVEPLAKFQADRLVARWKGVLLGEISQRAERSAYRLMAKARRSRALAALQFYWRLVFSGVRCCLAPDAS